MVRLFVLGFAGLLCFTRAAAGQSMPQGIAVAGIGEVRARPNVLEIDLQTSGAAELSSDAVIKFRDTKRRVQEAFSALKMKDLQIIEKSVAVSSGDGADRAQAMMRGMPMQNAGKSKVAISAVLQLHWSGIRDLPPEKVLETVSKLLDVARDSGSNVGASADDVAYSWRYGTQINTSMVRFVLEDPGELHKQAYKLAVAHAEAKAKQLAELNHVTVGALLAVEETPSAGQSSQYPYQNRNAEPSSELKVSSEKFGEVPVVVRLNVRYAIGPGAGAAKPVAAAGPAR